VYATCPCGQPLADVGNAARATRARRKCASCGKTTTGPRGVASPLAEYVPTLEGGKLRLQACSETVLAHWEHPCATCNGFISG
jgi:hypothetical protein